VRLLPWVAALERLERRHGYDCSECTLTRVEKERLKCGWFPASDAVQMRGWGAIGRSPIPDICPGYTIRLPQVQFVARMFGWEKRRSLPTHLAARGIEPTQLQMDLVDIMASEWSRAESWEYDERARKR